MIMISDMTMNNYTAQATPNWMAADNFATLLNQKQKTESFLNRLQAFLMGETSTEF